MEARMRRDFEAVDRGEAAEAMAKAMAEAREWARIEAEAEAGRDKYRGVRKVPSGKYVAEIRDPNTGKQVWLGTYSAALVAACAYDIAARSLQRDKAKPNFAYPPPPKLVSAVAAAPRRRVHSIPAPPEPPAPAPAPAPAPFVDYLSIQTPATAPASSEPATAPASSEPAPCPVCPLRHVGRTGTARARIVRPAPAPKKEPEITMKRPISPESFAIQAAEDAYRRLADRVGFFMPPLHMVAPAFSTDTGFSYTAHPAQRDSASSSSTSRRLMLKKPKVFAYPTTATTSTPSTNEDCEFTGDNFTGVPVPWFFSLPPAARMPFDIDRAL